MVPGSPCASCNSCELYQKEADEVLVRQAAAQAEREWIQLNPGACV